MPNLELSRFRERFGGYTELRAHVNRTTNIASLRGNILTNAKSEIGGVSARAYRSGSWGFASSSDTSDESVIAVIKAAEDNAAFLDSREQKGVPALPSAPATSENTFFTQKPRLTQRELVDLVRELDAYVAATYPALASRTVLINCLETEKNLITSDGSRSHSMIPRSIVRVGMTMVKEGAPVDLSTVYGGLGQFEDAITSLEPIYEGLARQYEHLMKKSEGVFAEAGTRTCVFDAELAGILAHEAIGHTTEADLVLGGSVAGALMNKEAASPLVTLVDFAHTALGKTCPVPVYIDDEGTKAEDAVIIDGGVLRSFMHNKESAMRFGVAPTGNARAFAFSDEPLIRMRNTAILPGTSKLEDMIASVDDGYYLMKPSNGQADSTSEFMFGVVLGYEIKKGKLARAIKDTTISGIAFDLLRSVTMVSSDMKWSCAGMCGKKQGIAVGMGGPAIKCLVNLGGR